MLYNMAKRRNIFTGIYMGECWLVGLSIMVIAYHFFNNRTLIRQNYVYTILTKLLGDIWFIYWILETKISLAHFGCLCGRFEADLNLFKVFLCLSFDLIVLFIDFDYYFLGLGYYLRIFCFCMTYFVFIASFYY